MKLKYTLDELKEFEDLLKVKQEQNNAQLNSYQEQLEEITENGKDEHGLENSGFNAQVETLMSSIDRITRHNIMVNNALLRIANNTYGRCAETDQLIDANRLKAVPTTTLSLEGKKIRDQKNSL